MTYSQLAQHIREQGGATFTGRELLTKKSGFVVAIEGRELRKPLGDCSFLSDLLAGYWESNWDILANPGYYLGAWIDNDDIVLDVVTVIPSQEFALAMAFVNNQKAIYDLSTGEVINAQR